jgi:hypothetical protein
MSINVQLTDTEANGFSQNGNGGDAPSGDDDWPNDSYQHSRSEPQEAFVWVM